MRRPKNKEKRAGNAPQVVRPADGLVERLTAGPRGLLMIAPQVGQSAVHFQQTLCDASRRAVTMKKLVAPEPGQQAIFGGKSGRDERNYGKDVNAGRDHSRGRNALRRRGEI
jgi:hypothetical protein